ncbi:MAG: hypothetical protein RJB37_4181 [Pseudomonadota bacterium]
MEATPFAAHCIATTTCHSASPASITAAPRLIRRRQVSSNRARQRPTPAHSTSHHSADPQNTPAIIGPGAAGTALPAASAPKIAMNEKMVDGLDSVSTKVPAKSLPNCVPPGSGAALGAGEARHSDHAIHSSTAQPSPSSTGRACASASITSREPKAPSAP